MNSIVELKNLSKSYGPVLSLKPTNLKIGNNEIVGLIGDNGAGKSTLIKLITGLESPTSGEIFIKDKKIDLNKYSVKISQKLGVSLSHIGYFTQNKKNQLNVINILDSDGQKLTFNRTGYNHF